MSEELQFRTVLRGYDPEQVRSAVDDLQTSVVTARRIAADRTIELTRMQEHLGQVQRELDLARTQLGELEHRPAASAAAPVDVGARIGSILALASEEAEELRSAGREEARRRLDEADAALATARDEAERLADQMRVKARDDATRIVDEARHHASELQAEASRDAEARRTEAQAILDRHREQADAVAAFRAQVDQHAERLQLALSRVEQLAREEAGLVQRQAQEHTTRVQRDLDNQLAAVDARRESITAQLGTVGDLLRELGGSAPGSVGQEGTDARAPGRTDAGTDDVTATQRAFDHASGDGTGEQSGDGTGEQSGDGAGDRSGDRSGERSGETTAGAGGFPDEESVHEEAGVRR
jgi:DivIVA domain-containing protein